MYIPKQSRTTRVSFVEIEVHPIQKDGQWYCVGILDEVLDTDRCLQLKGWYYENDRRSWVGVAQESEEAGDLVWLGFEVETVLGAINRVEKSLTLRKLLKKHIWGMRSYLPAFEQCKIWFSSLRVPSSSWLSSHNLAAMTMLLFFASCL